MLYKKNDKLNRDLYRVHLQAAKDWGKMCYPIQNSIQDSLKVEMEKKYKNIDDKIKKLVLTQAETPDTKIQFYPRVIKMADIVFTDEKKPSEYFVKVIDVLDEKRLYFVLIWSTSGRIKLNC